MVKDGSAVAQFESDAKGDEAAVGVGVLRHGEECEGKDNQTSRLRWNPVAAMSPSTKIRPSQSAANGITAGDLYDGARYVMSVVSGVRPALHC